MDYGKYFGGAYTILLRQIELMKKRGYRIIVFFSDYYGKEMSAEYQIIYEQIGVEFEWGTYQFSSQPEDLDIICIDRNYECLRDKVSRYNPDILHSVQINPCAELIGRELKVPHIMNVYQLLPAFFTIDYIDIFPHYHICDSVYYAKKWSQYLKTDSICIRTAADKDVHSKQKFNNEDIRFICAGVICRRKNQFTIIKAFHKAIQFGIKGKLVLCGYADGEYADECRRYVETHQLQENIIFKGFCTDMRSEYGCNDVLICGSICESYPNVIIEAMAAGLAIISTPVAGVPEIIKDGTNGYLTKDYSVESIFEKIVQVSDNAANKKIERILKNAQDTFSKNHSSGIVSEQLVKYYQYVLDDYKEQGDKIKIDGFRRLFQDIIEKFKMFEPVFTYPYEVAAKLYYLYHVTDIINSANEANKSFFIWGTGHYGTEVKEMLEVFFPQICIDGFIDSKKRGDFWNYKIYRPEEIIHEKETIIFVAALNGQGKIIEKLEISGGKIFNKDYFILSPRNW